MYTLSCCGGWLPGPAAEKPKQAAALGWKAYEDLGWSGWDLDAVKSAIEESGCSNSCLLVQSRDPEVQKLLYNERGITRPEAKEAFLQGIRETIEACQTIGCKNIVYTSGNAYNKGTPCYDHGNVVEASIAAAPLAEAAGITLVLEPLNAICDHGGIYLQTSLEGFAMIREIASPNVKLLFDIYHQQITEGNVIRNLVYGIEKGLIGHIHVGDNPGRKQPGTGELNYMNIFKAIADAGYDRYVVFECGRTEAVEVVTEKMFALQKQAA
ncbi:MAG: TIM barrel protein [Oscillospiraceae bacterium]|jgi:hydroxypyruvate isomerase|nr:TIM barrel protein [Oscillospiraceae bacterium]